jgi:isoleucyl-tRNA synthetase
LNLPKTEFPMKANLAKREPEMLERWERMQIYERIRKDAKGRTPYILHDGPPYANGNIHLGTALNKIIKDVLIKARNMTGRDSVYVPGWDCHGLPIEHQVDKELGEKKAGMSQAEKRRVCRVYADKYVGIQRDQFKRLGVFGEWDRPYLTMSYDYEATTVASLGSSTWPGASTRARTRLLVRLLQDRPGRGRGRVPRPHDAVDLRQVPPRFRHRRTGPELAVRRSPS